MAQYWLIIPNKTRDGGTAHGPYLTFEDAKAHYEREPLPVKLAGFVTRTESLLRTVVETVDELPGEDD